MEDKKLVKLSVYIALASLLQMSEMVIPTFFPGVKVGFANIVTLIVLYTFSLKEALLVAGMRTIVTSLLIGSFLTPTFVLSFSAAIVSTLVMGILLLNKFIAKKISIISVSIFGALSHNLTQFALAYLLIVRHANFYWYLPIILISSLATGILTGIIARYLLRKIK
ncbi:Gx transporter family protein [bacterium]